MSKLDSQSCFLASGSLINCIAFKNVHHKIKGLIISVLIGDVLPVRSGRIPV